MKRKVRGGGRGWEGMAGDGRGGGGGGKRRKKEQHVSVERQSAKSHLRRAASGACHKGTKPRREQGPNRSKMARECERD